MLYDCVCVCLSVCVSVCLQVCSLMSGPTTRSWITLTCHSSTRTFCHRDPIVTENLYVFYVHNFFCVSMLVCEIRYLVQLCDKAIDRYELFITSNVRHCLQHLNVTVADGDVNFTGYRCQPP